MKLQRKSFPVYITVDEEQEDLCVEMYESTPRILETLVKLEKKGNKASGDDVVELMRYINDKLFVNWNCFDGDELMDFMDCPRGLLMEIYEAYFRTESENSPLAPNTN